MDLRKTFKDIILYIPRRLYARWVNHQYRKIPKTESIHRKIIKRVIKRQHVNVMFIASSLPMWRYESTLAALTKDQRFSTHVVITPFRAYTPEENTKNKSLLINYFDNLGVEFTVLDTVKEFKKIQRSFRPDIIFYVQPYNYTHDPGIDWRQNVDCLLAYIPYFLGMGLPEWAYNMNFHYSIWRHYLPSAVHLQEYRRLSQNNCINGVVVGEPRSDDFKKDSSHNPWKIIADGKVRKRIIWAPHFQLEQNDMFNRPDFIWTADAMLELARKFSDEVQFAFKPHPKLKSKLCSMPDWGKERADEYYRQWETMPNTQIEEGEYVDLFKTSDAMIHNCGSFTGEYLFTRKPVAYVSKDIEGVKAPFHSFGKRCVDAHYVLSTVEDIEHFIVDVVINGKDPLQESRDKVYGDLLTTPYDKTVGENIHDDLVKSLGLR